MTQTLYRVLSRADWQQTLTAGSVPRSAPDERDGFVHLSTSDTVLGTANLYFDVAAQPVVLEICSASLGGALRWEPVAHREHQLFPHLYGTAIPLSAIRAVVTLASGPEGFYLDARTEV